MRFKSTINFPPGDREKDSGKAKSKEGKKKGGKKSAKRVAETAVVVEDGLLR